MASVYLAAPALHNAQLQELHKTARQHQPSQGYPACCLHPASVFLQIFKSHCAPEGRQHQLPSQMTVAELKEALSALGLNAAGKKAGLVERLEKAEAAAAEASGGVAGGPLCWRSNRIC